MAELQDAGRAPAALDALLHAGLFPPVHDRPVDPDAWLQSYVATYLERDVRMSIKVQDLATFQRFLQLCADRIGQLLNLSSLASDTGISRATAEAWLSVLQAGFLVFLARPHFTNVSKRLIKAPKIYFTDPGLAAWLIGIRSAGHLRSRGEVDGRKLLDDFNRAPYGWFKDTTRYLAAGLLIAQAIRIKVGGQWLEAVGPKAAEALKNNTTFARIDIATNDKALPQETLNRAAKRLLDLTGEKVLPMAQKISQAVLRHFPAFRNEYSSLAVELTSSCLQGSARAQSLSKRLVQVLDRDASDAPTTLGAGDSSLVDDLAWAREVRKALDNDLGTDAKEAATLAAGVAALPKVGVLENLANSTAILRDELAELLGREDFFASASDIRNRLTALREQVKAAASGLAREITAHLDSQRESIMAMAEWAELPADDRAEFSNLLDGTAIPDASDIDGIRHLLNCRMEMDANLSRIRAAVVERHRKRQEEAAATRPDPVKEDPAKTPIPMKIRVRRRYTAADHAALEQTVGALSTGLHSLKSQSATEVTIELD